ncbi:hypothetical protein O181_048673 [Austropuccinia psidii MF-1]|uniref:FAD-binding FR-type domain-containing protein n=1 Tax=Austropuccinia psidii MF-1 TaxID=1389203 RepID=A0A9Q3HKP9_9BASI|nr:hypothetical protein [Austropuccinia psidii MF-1]
MDKNQGVSAFLGLSHCRLFNLINCLVDASSYFATSLLAIDYLLAFLKTSLRSAVFTSHPGGLTQVEIDRVGEGWKAGQHVYLRVFNGFRAFEKHPFTIANAPASASTTGRTTLLLVIKSAGDFTRHVHHLGYAEAAFGNDLEKRSLDFKKYPDDFCRAASDCRLAVSVEGPYGVSYMEMCDFETVVLVGGGSGFTYCMANFEEIVGTALKGYGVTKRVFILWPLRDLNILQVFAESLKKTLNSARSISIETSIRLHITTPIVTGTMNTVSPAQIIRSRIEPHAVISEALEATRASIDGRGETVGCGVAIGVCGPPELRVAFQAAVSSADSSLAAKAGGIHFHSCVLSILAILLLFSSLTLGFC